MLYSLFEVVKVGGKAVKVRRCGLSHNSLARAKRVYRSALLSHPTWRVLKVPKTL